MKKMYSLCVRFDLSDDRQARISKHLQSLHENTCQSINGFVIDAIANYIDYQSYTREQHMEDMRKAMREEMQRLLISSMPHQAPVKYRSHSLRQNPMKNSITSYLRN